jgi:hypothetical protein
MTPAARCSCVREQDVLDLVAIDQWPSRADAALLAHVESCEVCGDLAFVATALGGGQEPVHEPVRVPDATIVWYGARLMARLDHTQRAARPLMIAQGVAAASVLVVTTMLAFAFGPAALGWVRDIATQAWPGASEVVARVEALSPWWRWLGAAILAWSVAVPLALSLARFADRGGETGTGRSRL